MENIYLSDIVDYENQEATFNGWVYNTRSVRKIWFLILRDGTDTVSYTHLTLPTNREV